MANNTKFNGWTSVLNSVKTPLGFFALVLLVLDGIILATAPLTQIPVLAPVGVLGVLVAGVFAIVWKKPLVLYHPKDWPKAVTVNLLFPIEAIQVDLDVKQCILEIRDREGREKPKVTPNLKWDRGGWTFQLPEDVVDTDSVRLELVEHNGRKWKVKPFPPYGIDVGVLQIN